MRREISLQRINGMGDNEQELSGQVRKAQNNLGRSTQFSTCFGLSVSACLEACYEHPTPPLDCNSAKTEESIESSLQ
jgi:hypothetical protein